MKIVKTFRTDSAIYIALDQKVYELFALLLFIIMTSEVYCSKLFPLVILLVVVIMCRRVFSDVPKINREAKGTARFVVKQAPVSGEPEQPVEQPVEEQAPVSDEPEKLVEEQAPVPDEPEQAEQLEQFEQLVEGQALISDEPEQLVEEQAPVSDEFEQFVEEQTQLEQLDEVKASVVEQLADQLQNVSSSLLALSYTHIQVCDLNTFGKLEKPILEKMDRLEELLIEIANKLKEISNNMACQENSDNLVCQDPDYGLVTQAFNDEIEKIFDNDFFEMMKLASTFDG